LTENAISAAGLQPIRLLSQLQKMIHHTATAFTLTPSMRSLILLLAEGHALDFCVNVLPILFCILCSLSLSVPLLNDVK